MTDEKLPSIPDVGPTEPLASGVRQASATEPSGLALGRLAEVPAAARPHRRRPQDFGPANRYTDDSASFNRWLNARLAELHRAYLAESDPDALWALAQARAGST
jgi:hypothetical protein